MAQKKPHLFYNALIYYDLFFYKKNYWMSFVFILFVFSETILIQCSTLIIHCITDIPQIIGKFSAEMATFFLGKKFFSIGMQSDIYIWPRFYEIERWQMKWIRRKETIIVCYLKKF